jgi:GT2 family glycosyltransferase
LVAILDRDSGDNLELIRKLIPASQLKVLDVNYEDIGFSKMLNMGVHAANSDLIARLDDDDVATTDRIENQIRFFEDNETVLVTGWAEVVDLQGLRKYEIKPSDNEVELFKELRKVNVIPHSTVLFRKEQFLQVGGYRHELVGCEDYDLWLRLVGLGRFRSVEKKIITYLSNPVGMTSKPIPRSSYKFLAQSRQKAIAQMGYGKTEFYLNEFHWRLQQFIAQKRRST